MNMLKLDLLALMLRLCQRFIVKEVANYDPIQNFLCMVVQLISKRHAKKSEALDSLSFISFNFF